MNVFLWALGTSAYVPLLRRVLGGRKLGAPCLPLKTGTGGRGESTPRLPAGQGSVNRG